jgi:hypothetical protein
MAFWEKIEPTLKIAGIVGGLAAAFGVVVQLKDINDKETQRRIDDWQNATVYEILDENVLPLTLRELAPRYAAKANNFPEGVPRTALDERHLRVALIRLMQSQAVVQLGSPGYTIRREGDQIESFARAAKMISERERQLAFHSQLAMQVLAQANEALTSDQLSLRMVAMGGDKAYLKDNIPVVIEAMRQMGEIKGQRDGRYVAGDGMGGRESIELMKPSAQIAPILPQIDGPILRYVLISDLQDSGTCFHDKNPVIVDQQTGSFIDRLRKLNLVTIDIQPGGRDDAGKSCTATETLHYSDLIKDLQNYYYSALGLVFDHVRPPP